MRSNDFVSILNCRFEGEIMELDLPLSGDITKKLNDNIRNAIKRRKE